MASVSIERSTHQRCNDTGDTSKDWRDGLCFCECDVPPSVLEPSELILTVNEKIGVIFRRLVVDPSDTSSARRKLNSAVDSRSSSTGIGTAGIIILNMLFGAILVVDIRVLLGHLTACRTRRPKSIMK